MVYSSVVVLGPVGHNVGAGMTGGQAFLYEREAEQLMTRINTDLVEVLRPEADTVEEIRWLIERHAELTRSALAERLLAGWEDASDQFWHVLPRERPSRIQGSEALRVATA